MFQFLIALIIFTSFNVYTMEEKLQGLVPDFVQKTYNITIPITCSEYLEMRRQYENNKAKEYERLYRQELEHKRVMPQTYRGLLDVSCTSQYNNNPILLKNNTNPAQQQEEIYSELIENYLYYMNKLTQTNAVQKNHPMESAFSGSCLTIGHNSAYDSIETVIATLGQIARDKSLGKPLSFEALTYIHHLSDVQKQNSYVKEYLAHIAADNL